MKSFLRIMNIRTFQPTLSILKAFERTRSFGISFGCIIFSLFDRHLSNQSTGTTSENAFTNIPASKKDSIRTENWCYTKAKKFVCDFTWIIQDYNLNLASIVGNKLKSSAFSAANDSCKWYLELMMEECYDRDYDNTYDWLELDLKILPNTPTDGFTPISGNVAVSLLNLNNEKSSTCVQNFVMKNQSGEVNLKLEKCNRKVFQLDTLLPEDELRIHCKLSFIRDVINISNQYPLESDEFNPMHDLVKLFNDKDSSDITFDINGKKYPAHKTILAARSSVFKTMLEQDMLENRKQCVEINDIDERIFQEVLRYIYTGKVENLEDIAFELMPVAGKYDLGQLKNMCLKALSRLLSEKTVVKILIFSELNGIQSLKTQALEYIRANLTEVMRSEGWNDLKSNPDLMKNILDP